MVVDFFVTALAHVGKRAGRRARAVAGGAGPERGAAETLLLVVGLLATLVVTTIVTRIARRALAEATGD